MSAQEPPAYRDTPEPVRLDVVLSERRITALYRYWQAKRAGRRAPARADIDPSEIKDLLANLFLIEVLEEPRRFRYRLIGTELVTFSGRDSTGRVIDSALYGDAAAPMLARLNETVEGWRAQLSLSSVYWLTRNSWNRVAVIFLPLSADGEAVNMVLGGMVIEPLNQRPTDPSATERYTLE